ncbi:MAG TPA: dienelactone hydrolase family protein [Jatrophihabitans sp.]|jgi:carboxymethylenebutenolidase
MGDSLTASTVAITAPDGESIPAYLARPAETNTRGGVVVIHHMPGYDRGSKEITRRFAELGYDAICPNLHHRDAPGAAPDDAAAASRASGGVPDERLIGDVTAAAAYLRDLPSATGKVGVIGFCSGGRQAVLVGCTVDVDAVVDCYGAFVTGTPPQGFPLQVSNLVERLPNLRCPLLGLFGNEDRTPSPEHVDELEALLREHGKDYEFHRYDDAGHGFFSPDRPSYRVAAASDGWERIADFFASKLGA